MALKDNLRRKRSQRFDYVSVKPQTEFEEMNRSSTDCEEEIDRKPKVRAKITVQKLMKQGEHFKVDGDHIYTTVSTLGKGEAVTFRSKGATRKRNISEDSDDKPAKQKCSSKNAIMARINRERKKLYISTLESENQKLTEENNHLNAKIEAQSKMIASLQENLRYVKNLLANSKELSQILTNLKQITGLPVTSSLTNMNKENERQSVNENSSAGMSNIHPRTKFVSGGPNFPILDKDIILSSTSYSRSCSYSDCESPPFDFENEFYENFESSLNSSLFNFDTSNIDLGLSEPLHFDDSSTINNNKLDAGICVHVNKNQISVEICSICNKKAAMSTSTGT